MNFESTIKEWLTADSARYEALQLAASLHLNDWCIAAGFVRNLVWDKLHGYTNPTPLADLDLIYFDPEKLSAESDLAIESTLKKYSSLNWSVKNQARMHIRNDDPPYSNTANAMMYWVEVETAIGARLTNNDIEFIAPFGFSYLESLTITLNRHRPKPLDFDRRIAQKQWLECWPKLRVVCD